MRRARIILLALALALAIALAACEAPPENGGADAASPALAPDAVIGAGTADAGTVDAETADTEAADAEAADAEAADTEAADAEAAGAAYIWTVSIDGARAKEYGEGQLTANYTVHLSASKEGGDSPTGEYRGELRVEYEGVPDEATLFAIELLGGSYDFEGWGENDAISFAMEAYDHERMMEFVALAYQGEGARTAPLLAGTAMYIQEDIPFTESDWAMALDAGLEGVFGVNAEGDEAGASSSVYTPFGGGSSASDEAAPLRCSLHFIDENRAQFNIWSHGKLDVNLSFDGTLDKVPLASTVPVG